MQTEFIVIPDTRWPTCPDRGPVLKGLVNDVRILGWWDEAGFQDWLKVRGGFVATTDGDMRTIVARLTNKERQKAQLSQ